MSSIRIKLLRICNEKIATQISALKINIEEVRIAANEDTKSSAGDKYETGRAMAHLEIEKLQRQRNEAEKMLQTLAMINPSASGLKVGLGSLVSTPSANYFISIPLGKIRLDNEEWICLSAASPLGFLLMGKKSGEDFIWNQQRYKITVLS